MIYDFIVGVLSSAPTNLLQENLVLVETSKGYVLYFIHCYLYKIKGESEMYVKRSLSTIYCW